MTIALDRNNIPLTVDDDVTVATGQHAGQHGVIRHIDWNIGAGSLAARIRVAVDGVDYWAELLDADVEKTKATTRKES